jgi:transposase
LAGDLRYLSINLRPVIDYKIKYEDALTEITLLKHRNAELQRLIFGSKSERFVPSIASPSQLSLSINADKVVQCSVADAKKISYTRANTTVVESSKESHVRMKLPEDLERRELIIEPPGLTKECRLLGEAITEELEYEPGKLYVNRYVRRKYVSADNTTILVAPMIERPLPRAIAGPGLLSQIVIDKYVDHLPLYRQRERFSREKINIPYSTITDWVSNTCRLITPLYEALKRQVLASDYLHVDETPIKVLDKERKGDTHRGYFWVYHNSIDDVVLFEYQQGRGREGPLQMLKDFKGHLQTDAYAAYDIFDKSKDITVLNCLAHARRKFFEAKDNDTVRSVFALAKIKALYEIERIADETGLNDEQRLQSRQSESLPILIELGHWMQKEYMQVLPASPIGKALAYSIKRWDKMIIYTTDAKLNIDNNPVENAIRPTALGRKNYLFAGSHDAAQRSAMLYSLLGTCKLHEVNPHEWMKTILQRIAQHPINKIDQLLPQNWHITK